MIHVGIDTGGTFTDFVIKHGSKLLIHKIPSTPTNPSQAVLKGLKAIIPDGEGDLEIIHGTTVSTNALIERKGGKVALITTKGFEDVIEIARQNRDELYNIFWEKPSTLVGKEHRYGVNERIDFKGRILKRINENEISKLALKLKRGKFDSIAISLLHSYVNDKHEKIIENKLKDLGIPLSVSSKIFPEFREYERTSTVVTNSYLIPKVKKYIEDLSSGLDKTEISIMQSNGGLIKPSKASKEPVRIILSGPAAGVVGAFSISSLVGYKKVITYDMGGTSTDLALCDGELNFKTEAKIAGVSINVPMIDVTTIGAGGGSIAYIDSGGALKVGPMSAGADPGPACYGKGINPTVTDANLVLGRLREEWFLGGNMKISYVRAKKSMDKLSKNLGLSLEKISEGIISVVNANMERAMRVISLGKGHDPRDFSFLSFGGAGGLHACELARNLELKNLIFPINPGVLSAMGMLMADSFKDFSKTVFIKSDSHSLAKIGKQLKLLERKALNEFPKRKLLFKYFLDVRYRRQSHELTIPFSKDFENVFHRTHKKNFGYMKKNDEIDIVTVRLRVIEVKNKLKIARLKNKKKSIDTMVGTVFYNGKRINIKIYKRDDLYEGLRFDGPSLILENTSTIFIPPDFKCGVEQFGNIISEVL